ncbi:MAG: DUF4747 family protein [Gallionellaceae bacterium]|jgi:hypothetical protein
MAKFRQYNIQLLPLDTRKTPEVGIAGYKNLFALFHAYTTNAYKTKIMANEAKPLANDTYICPFVVHADEKFAYGKFLKYHKAETVTDFYSHARLFEARSGETAIANTHYFNFVFDYEFHRFAIEENGSRLPSPDIMMSTLKHFLERLATQHFPLYEFTLNLISDQQSLKEVLSKGNEFGPIEVSISFPNSHRLTDTLREMKDYNVHHFNAHISPARGARMTGMPKYIREVVMSAAELGKAKITFYKMAFSDQITDGMKRMFYSTSENPLHFILRQKTTEDESGFMKRVWMNLKLIAKNANK